MSKDLTPKDKNHENNFDEYDEYYLIKENNVYKFIIGTNLDQLIIKYKNYYISLNNNDLSILTKCMFNTINDAYEYISNIFEQNKVTIKEIKLRKTLTLLLKVDIYNIEKNIEIILLYNKENKLNDNIFKNEIKNLKNEINILKNEINNIKNINKKEYMKEIKINNNLINYSNPEKLEFSNIITKDSFTSLVIDNAISVFKSLNDILYLIYGNRNKSIILYNLNNNQIFTEIKNAHDEIITNIRHYFDSINKRDLILSISCDDNNLKIWDIAFNCLLNLKNINQHGCLYSGTILNNNNQNYIITSNSSYKCEPIKIFDFKGNKIKEINNSDYSTYIIDIYYDNNYNKNYIITGNDGYVISYDFNENKIYHKYFENEDKYCHFSLLTSNIDKIIKLIESSAQGIIRIWNFHKGDLLNKIKVINDKIFGICLWNYNNLFVGCQDHTMKLININNGEIIKSFSGHKEEVVTIKKIIHQKYGECLISFGGDIILWKKQ